MEIFEKMSRNFCESYLYGKLFFFLIIGNIFENVRKF